MHGAVGKQDLDLHLRNVLGLVLLWASSPPVADLHLT